MTDRVPLEFPLYGARFGEAASRYRRKLFVFSGRASRSEFWWAFLVETIISTAVTIVITVVWMILIFAAAANLSVTAGSGSTPDLASVGGTIALFYGGYAVIILVILLLQVSLLGIMSRRLHDSGFSALWLLLLLVPTYGMYAVLVMCALDTKPVGIRYDRSPGGPILYPPTLVHGSAYPAPVDPLVQQAPPAPPFPQPAAPTAEPPAAPPTAPPTA